MDKNVLHFPLDDETRARLEAEGRAEVMQPQNEAGGVGDDARARGRHDQRRSVSHRRLDRV